jgi:hypothetical protein
MANIDSQQEGLKWQVGVGDHISEIYLRELDKSFEEVITRIPPMTQLSFVARRSPLIRGCWPIASWMTRSL